jgi:hypothetical protein
VDSTLALHNSPTYSLVCRGPIVGNLLYARCIQNGTSLQDTVVGTATEGTPLRIHTEWGTPLPNNPNGYTLLYNKVDEVRQEAGLVGTWSRSDLTLTLNSDGTVTASSGGNTVTGTYQVVGTKITEVDTGGLGACPQSQVGTYSYSISGNTMTITLVSDPCTGRAATVPGTYTRL